MNESFLHYIWQFQYFNKTQLHTTDGEELHIFQQGMFNTHAGPDFSNARIRIGNMEWVGNVELHLRASGWLEHKHHEDDAYENVILHVVWDHDESILHKDGSALPTLELKNRVDGHLLLKYKKLVNSPTPIPCAASFQNVNELTRLSMLDKALMHRLEAKATLVAAMHRRNNNDWEETAYQLLCKNFGFKVNAEPFLQLAQALPYKILLKQADKHMQLEAFLFGQAGFLNEEPCDNYSHLLQREYNLLSTKYQLKEHQLSKAQWKFMRLRPANFPTIRMAQLAALLHARAAIFSSLLEASVSYTALIKLFSIHQSDYWLHHYQLGAPAQESIPGLGSMSIDIIIINAVVPLLVAYGKAKDEQEWIDRAVALLQQIPAEQNSIVRQWTGLQQPVKTAFDSQALIELYNNFCLKRRCLDCNIGFSLVKPPVT